MGQGRGIRSVAAFALAAGAMPALAALTVPGSKGAGDDYSPDRLYPGEQVLLIAEGGQTIPCAATDAAWAQLIRIQRDGRSKEALSALRERGEVYEVPAGTEGIIIESSHLVPGLKLLDSDRAGQLCFTDRLNVKRFRRDRPRPWRY